jgi:hypothetical protein
MFKMKDKQIALLQYLIASFNHCNAGIAILLQEHS